MLVGIVAGTYSSIYVAAPLTEWIDTRMSRAQRRKAPRGQGPRKAA
jgi:preprotein translocase subunit SecF